LNRPPCLSCRKYRGHPKGRPKCTKYPGEIPREIIFQGQRCPSQADASGESIMNESKMGKNEVKERFVELRAAGLSYEAVSKELGVSRQTLINWSKGLALDIQNARGLRLDELSQKYIVSKEKRIEVFGKRLDAILAELDKRNLADLETEKLLTLALKYGEMLRTEYEPLTLAGVKPLTELKFDETVTWQG